jgi:N-acetyl-gamma-glutamyl-phosphate reductase
MINVGIVGGTGYTGIELLRLLINHPQINIKVITSRTDTGIKVSDRYHNLRGRLNLTFSEPEIETLVACDLVFFATPHGVAQTLAPELLSRKIRVIDLSADFRLSEATLWSQWYGKQHSAPDLLTTAIYGLPEVNREAIASAQLVACPGCYPTAVQLGLLPLIEQSLVDPQQIIANVASGASGAGRQAEVDNLLTEIGDSFKAYAVNGHRHTPEIEQGLRRLQPSTAKPVTITFVPHLLPIIRGIHGTIYGNLVDTSVDLQALYEDRYKNEPFVDVMPPGSCPQTRSVKSSNMCRLSVFKQQNNRVIILSVIDNLTKGAAGQAIQNMNIMYGFDECAGLKQLALLP